MGITQFKGDIAVAKAIATFTLLKYRVSLPITDAAPYDLIIDDTEKLYKVQCKYTSTEYIDLRRIHSNSKGYVIKQYKTFDYDWLYIFHKDGREYLIKDHYNNSSLRLNLLSEKLMAGSEAGASNGPENHASLMG